MFLSKVNPGEDEHIMKQVEILMKWFKVKNNKLGNSGVRDDS